MQTHKPLSDPTPFPPPKKKIYVVAGNYNEYHNFVRKKRQEGVGPEKEYKFVESILSIRGLSEIEGVFIGSWKFRKDILEIGEQIRIIKSKMTADAQYKKGVDMGAHMLAKEIDKEVLNNMFGPTTIATGISFVGTLSSGASSLSSVSLEDRIMEKLKKYVDESILKGKV